VQEDWLKALIAAAEHRQFGRAASEQFVVVSTLSRRITALERATGLVLVDRGSTGACLTPAGEAFVPVARRLLCEMQHAKAAAAALRAGRQRPKTALER
jgi:DNA-binding transcriptional LysR family regulator